MFTLEWEILVYHNIHVHVEGPIKLYPYISMNTCILVCIGVNIYMYININIQQAYSVRVRLFGGEIISRNRYSAGRAKVSPARAHIFRSNANTISRVALRFEIKIVRPSKYIYICIQMSYIIIYSSTAIWDIRVARNRRLTLVILYILYCEHGDWIR